MGEQKKSRRKKEEREKQTSGEERIFHSRKYARVSLQMDVEFDNGRQFEKGASHNISFGGIFVKSEKPLPLGEMTRVRFVLDPEKKPVEIGGRIAWVRNPEEKPLADNPTGMGIEFIYENDDSRKLVGGFVRDLFDLLRIMAISEKYKNNH